MPDSITNGTILQPNPYAGGRIAPPIIMPTEMPGAGGNSASGNGGAGQNSVIIDDDVSLSGPSAGLNGTPQTHPPYPSGNVQPTNPGTDFTNTVPGMIGPGQSPSTGNATGWRKSGNDWYYLDPITGGMAKGWKMLDGRWYYLNLTTGIMETGWINPPDGKWYYLDLQDGHMLINWQKIEGEWYYLETTNGNGQMVTGWKRHNEKWYFLFDSGAMAHGGWINIDGKWYRFRDSSGEMEVSKIIPFEGKKYYVGDDGAMVTNTTDSQLTVTYNGVTYEVDGDGVCTAISVTAPPDADIQAWREYISNDASLSEIRKIIVLEALETIEQKCKYHQLRAGFGKPSSCMKDCDGDINPNQEGEYNFNRMANYNLEDPLYLDCSFFVKHCYWKAGIEMGAQDTHMMLVGGEFVVAEKDRMKPADIAVRWREYIGKDNKKHSEGHVMLFVGWTSGHGMVWAEMKKHSVDGKVSIYTPDNRYNYKTFKNGLG